MAGLCGDCTKCCEAIHVAPKLGESIVNASDDIPDGRFLNYLWERITPEEAREINPYMFSDDADSATQEFVKTAYFFKCRMLEKGVGCKIHESRPQICRNYLGDRSYKKDCAVTDMKIEPDDFDIVRIISGAFGRGSGNNLIGYIEGLNNG